MARPAPGLADLPSISVKVGHKGAGRLEFVELADIGRVTDRKNPFEPVRAGGDGTAMHEAVKTGAATVGTISTLPYAAEG